jgi:glycosyltransferase involved in cell wall biosynthesis
MFYSIICLTYKRPELLEESVYSVLQQTFKDWELLIINDCEDQTIHYDHPQVKIFNFKEKFKCISDKRNFGKSNAKGDWIFNLDDDDLLLPTYLENLKKYLETTEWICYQKPIIYYDDPSKVYLSPVPQANVFVYSKQVAQQYNYESNGTDEVSPFYAKIAKSFWSGRRRYTQLPPNECGYVWRQDVGSRKYSLADVFGQKTTEEEQDAFLRSIESAKGDIFLKPHWNKDYVEFIRTNMKQVDPMYAYGQFKGGAEMLKVAKEAIERFKSGGPKQLQKIADESKEAPENSWLVVKPTWANAMKFLSAAKSRGILSTALDAVGINGTSGERVSEEIYKQRKLSCFGDSSLGVAPCSRLYNAGKRGYFCGSCGCGKQDLARLDADTPDEYTKLHYPQLECPLKRKGFSNAQFDGYLKVSDKPLLSIIIPVLNDNEELNLTIRSIRETSPPNVEIIVIDDKSDTPTVVTDKNVKLVRLEERKGVGSTRHLGATMATTDYLLFVDSHMRFETNWYNNAMKRLTSNPENVVWCGTCLGLDKDNMDVTKPKGEYHGARLSLYERKESQIFEGKWIDVKEGNDYEISCLMGACYFFHKSWFMKIGGTKSLKMWGSDEPLLSAKTYLAGGSIKMMKDVKIGHKFRDNASYSTDVSYLIYNKLRSIKMLFSNELYECLKSKVPSDGNKQAALQMMERDKEEIEAERQYYKTIFVKDEKWLCEKFNLKV